MLPTLTSSNRLVYILLFFLLWLPLVGVVGAKREKEVKGWDKTDVEYRPASDEKMEAYKQMKIYNYDRFVEPVSLWSRMWRWLLGKIGIPSPSEKSVSYVLIGLSVLIFSWVILKLLGVEITRIFVFGGHQKKSNIAFKQEYQDIYSNNMEHVLDLAIKKKAYREAVRLLYLLSLRHLDSLEMIQWRPWKTNRDYYYELVLLEHKALFNSLQMNYEYIWYGQFYVEEDKFNEVRLLFEQFEELIETKKIRA